MQVPVSPVPGKPWLGFGHSLLTYLSPGALIAGTWAAMQYIGEKYVVLISYRHIKLDNSI
jgi:hypothetical protein